jgi:uncharacterized protein
MSRFTAILFLAFASMVSPAFSADAPPGTTFLPEDIDPATGLSRSTVVRPLGEAVPVPDARRVMPPSVRRPHIALVLPTASPALGRLADAVRQGFMAAHEVARSESPPVVVTATENEAQALLDACRHAQDTGAILIVGGLTRDGVTVLAGSDCVRQPILALNELPGPHPEDFYTISLSLELEARQAALLAVESGMRSALVIDSPSAISRRVREAFEREWTRAAGEVRHIPYGGSPVDAALVRERIAASRVDMVFLALDAADAVAVRPYISGMLPVYATSLSVNPRAEPLVNLDLEGLRYLEMPWFIQPDHPAVMVYPRPTSLVGVDQERLYALGIDAFRIALLLLGAQSRPLVLDGVTGRISLEPGNHFVRQLSAAEVDGGKVIPLRAP